MMARLRSLSRVGTYCIRAVGDVAVKVVAGGAILDPPAGRAPAQPAAITVYQSGERPQTEAA